MQLHVVERLQDRLVEFDVGRDADAEATNAEAIDVDAADVGATEVETYQANS